MSISSKGKNLVFIISQPRAGSTLLQRMLACNSEIYTMGESWLMLHPLYFISSQEFDAKYDSQLARGVIFDFIENLPNGERDFIHGIRIMYSNLYNKMLKQSGKSIFLDKTPRYYLIITELQRTFPEASIIVLFRNPLAVLCSILKTWIKGSWLLLYRNKFDLIDAPALLVNGMNALGDKAIIVRFEDLVSNPRAELKRICERLNIGFTNSMINYGTKNLPHWKYGDQNGIYKYGSPSLGPRGKWKRDILDSQIWRLANDYLSILGPEVINGMGYDFDNLQGIINRNKPSWMKIRFSFGLEWLTEKHVQKRGNKERALVWIISHWKKCGIVRTFFYLIARLLNLLNIKLSGNEGEKN
jgi:hypothetical protein